MSEGLHRVTLEVRDASFVASKTLLTIKILRDSLLNVSSKKTENHRKSKARRARIENDLLGEFVVWMGERKNRKADDPSSQSI